MLTFLSRSFREWLDSAVRREPAPHLHALPQPDDLAADLERLRGAWHRAQLRVLQRAAARDIPIARSPSPVEATAFVAGEGARIYSLDVFRQRRSPKPPTHSAA